MFVILPVFAIHAETLPGGTNLTLVGIAIGAYGLTQALLQIPFGWWSDRFGRKRVLLVGLVAACVGMYGLLAADAPAALGLPMLVAGVSAAAAGVTLSHRTSSRTVYRPDPWRAAEWLVALAGLATAGLLVAASLTDAPGITVAADPPQWPQLSLLPVLAVLIAGVGVWSFSRLPVDAYPDLSPPMVEIVTQWPGGTSTMPSKAVCAPGT